jgi:hypothetical protein
MQSNQSTPRRVILLLTASPKGTVPLRVDEDSRRIKDSLRQSDKRLEFDVQVEPAVTIAHIRRALLEHKPEIVIFCGHGAGPDGIVCEDETGKLKLIPTAALGNLFELARSDVKCVVLNACFTEIQANVIANHIPVVVGMKHSIGDEAASKFIEGFCDALFAGKEFVDCYRWGVNAIQLESIPEELTPVVKMKAPIKKTVNAHPKNSQELFIHNTKEKLTRPPTPLHGSSSGNFDPGLSISAPQMTIAEKRPLLRRMPKTAFLSLLIPILIYAVFLGTRQNDIAGNYIQESLPEDLNQRGDTSDQIRCDAVNTEAHVFFNSKIGKWQVIETTFWKYYFAPDPNHLETRYLIGSSKAKYVHEEYGRQGDKILMTGHPSEGQIFLQVEPLLGEPKLVAEIKEAVNKEIAKIKDRYSESRSKWSLDESGNLIKEKWYKDEDQSKAGKKEKFARRF